MKKLLERLFTGDTLSREEARDLLTRITSKEFNDIQVASLMTVYRMRPITVEELLGYRESLIDAAVPVDLSSFEATDIVGTGGDGKNTFNISTCACFVVAGAGYKVIKHGNHAASSVSGASTVLQNHGVKFTTDSSVHSRSLEGSGVAYLHAQLFHPALASVGPIRRAIGMQTIFNLLGPLVNPAAPSFQLLGVADLSQMRLYVATLQALGMGFSVINSLDGYDEISLTDDFKVASGNFEHVYTPEEIGFPRATQGSLYGGATAMEASAIFDSVLEGTSTPEQKNAVVVNSAFAIRNFSPEKPISECIAQARESLDSGKALASFKKFLEING